MYKTISAGVTSLSLSALMCSTAAASGFALNTQSAESLGAATAGAQATRATPGNAYFNPAAIVGVSGIESSLSFVGVLNDTSFENASGMLFGTVPVSGADAGESVIGDAVFPTGATAVKINDRLFAALAVYAPFGFNTSYDDASVVRYHGTFSQVVSGSITPILGFAINDDWSIAAGPRFQYLDVDIRGAVDAAGIEAALLFTSAVPGTDDVYYDFTANDWGVGYIVGIQGALTDRINVGVSFTSKVEHDLTGDAVFDISQSAAGQNLALSAGLFQDGGLSSAMTTPATIQIGASFDVDSTTRILASAVQTRWSSFQQLSTSFENPLQPVEITTQNWKNAWAGSLGVEKDLSARDTIRFGVMLEDDPVNPAFSSPRVPGAKRVWVSGGFSRELSTRATMHLAVSYVYNDTQPVDESGAYAENMFRGSFQGDVNISSIVAGIGLDWKF